MRKLLTGCLLCWLVCTTSSYATLSASYSPTAFACNGSVTNFDVSWTFWDTTDVVVTLTDSAGDGTVLVYGAGAGKYQIYAANNNYSSGGRIYVGTAYATGNTITITRSVPYTQGLSIQGDFIDVKTFETQLDKIVAQIQQLEYSGTQTNEISTALFIKYGTNQVIKIQATGAHAGSIYLNTSTGWVEQISFEE